jgi:hypothetical protein
MPHAYYKEHTMTIDSSKSPQTTAVPGALQPARTDDLLASGADAGDGARGFGGTAPEALQTGMEGIAGATVQGSEQSATPLPAGTYQTVQDNAGQVHNKQGS